MSLDKEIEIIHELATEVLKFEGMLCTVSDICGELDWYCFHSVTISRGLMHVAYLHWHKEQKYTTLLDLE